jgi:tRNA pseudouridine55 synthase
MIVAPHGFLNLNKPAGLTSHDCVARVRRLLSTKKVGHGGTLDPAATGVLPIAIGHATRLLPYLPTVKAYQAIIRFGLQTDTDDLEGKILTETGAAALELAAIREALPKFIGKIDQIPPAYSAIQVDGRRSYDRARAGEEVILPARPVEIHSITIDHWQPGEFPELTVTIVCGGGTYIRSIARDLGQALGNCATLANLFRTLSCNLSLSKSITLEDLAAAVAQDSVATIITPAMVALQHLAQWNLDADQENDWRHGRPILIDQPFPLGEPVSVAIGDQPLGIGFIQISSNGLILCPKVVLS